MGDYFSEHDQQYMMGYMGVVSALIFSSLGASYAMYKAASAIMALGIVKPEMIMKSSIPIVMAQVLGIYGIIMAIIIGQNSKGVCMQFQARATLADWPTNISHRGSAAD
jgi:ATP synthase proteolipid subunit